MNAVVEAELDLSAIELPSFEAVASEGVPFQQPVFGHGAIWRAGENTEPVADWPAYLERVVSVDTGELQLGDAWAQMTTSNRLLQRIGAAQ